VLILPDARPITQCREESFSPSAVILAASSFCVAQSCGRAPDNGEKDVLIITLSAIDLLLMGTARKGPWGFGLEKDQVCPGSWLHSNCCSLEMMLGWGWKKLRNEEEGQIWAWNELILIVQMRGYWIFPSYRNGPSKK